MTTPEMTTSKLTRALLALLVASAATIASAQESRPPTQHGEQRASEPRQGEQRQADAREGVLRLLPADSVTEHAVAIPGGTLTYTATAGTLSLFDQSGERSAAVYYRLCRQERRARQPSRHLRLQRRTGRGIGVSEPRLGRPAHPRVSR